MSGPRILVVDDNRDMADGLAMLLGELPAEVRVSYSGEEALTALRQGEGSFDLVLSDVRMPAIDGIELLGRIRADWPQLRVVLITAHGSIESAVDAMRHGARDYLTKPFDNEELIGIVRRNLALAGVPRGADEAAIVGSIAAVESEDLLAGLESAAGILRRAAGADDCEIFLRQPESEDLVLSAWAGQDGEALIARTHFEAGEGYPGIVTSSGRPLTVRGTLAADDRYMRQEVTARGLQSYACVPLRDAGGSIGSLHVMSRRSDYPVEQLIPLLEHAAVPLANLVRAGLGALRQSVDSLFGDLDEAPSEPFLRALLETFREVAGARAGTLALADPDTRRPTPVVSTGPASLLCASIEAGHWKDCPVHWTGRGFAPDGSRRQWPGLCRRGLPCRVSHPGCLPLLANGRLHGLVLLDFGRKLEGPASSRLVPLMTMAQQAAVRMQPRHAGIPVSERDETAEVVDRVLAPELEVRCLGPFKLSQRGQSIAPEAFPRSLALVLLKLLVLRAGAPVSKDVLIEQLWPDLEDPIAGGNRFHGVVHALRSVIEPYRTERRWIHVRSRGHLYYLDMDGPIDIDLVRYRHDITAGLQAARDSPDEAIRILAEAVELYRGDLFEDDPHADWCEAERRELRARQLGALEELAQLHWEAGATESALGALRLALRIEPVREDLHQSLIEMLINLGRRQEALVQYEDCRRLLDVELDARPAPALRALHAELLESLRDGA